MRRRDLPAASSIMTTFAVAAMALSPTPLPSGPDAMVRQAASAVTLALTEGEVHRQTVRMPLSDAMYAEKEEGKKLKQKTKDKATAKMGKIDIDYQVLHDAFFKYQTKPKMTIMGELYYEGKEYEMDLTGKKPGVLTAGSWSVPVHSFHSFVGSSVGIHFAL